MIVDEISLVEYSLFQHVIQLIQFIKQRHGGVKHQWIFFGDWLQITPTGVDEDDNSLMPFEGPLWYDIVDKTVVLQKNYRFLDQKLIYLCQHLRLGILNETVTNLLDSITFQSMRQAAKYIPANATHVFTTKKKVSSSTEEHLRNSNLKMVHYHSVDSGRFCKEFIVPKKPT